MTVHPYIPNSAPSVKRDMLKEVGVRSPEELLIDVPKKIRSKKKLKIPKSRSEYEVRRHVKDVLSRNRHDDLVNFVGPRQVGDDMESLSEKQKSRRLRGKG